MSTTTPTRFVFQARTPDALVASPPKVRTDYIDAGYRGRGSLCFRVTPTGEGSWSLLYRFPSGRAGKPRRLALGAFPVVKLAQARAAAEKAGGLLPDQDPGAQRDEVRSAAKKGLTWALLRTTWLGGHRAAAEGRHVGRLQSPHRRARARPRKLGAVLVPQTTVAQLQDDSARTARPPTATSCATASSCCNATRASRDGLVT
jgi:hypothetical protein